MEDLVGRVREISILETLLKSRKAELDAYLFPVKLRKAHKSFPSAFQKKSKYPNLPVTVVLRTTRVKGLKDSF